MWGRKSKIKQALTASVKAGANAYVGRKLKKRDNRANMQVRINAGARANGTTYSKLIKALNDKNVGLNRKVLSEIAANHPEVFKKIVGA